MAQKFSRTWWGKVFIEALESFSDSGRLSRGRSYANNDKIKSYKITNNVIKAKVRGSINPYFGVYKEPLYDTKIEIKTISPEDWSKIISYLGSKAKFVSQLLMGQIPDNIEDVFEQFNLHLLPHSELDFETDCSCPDWSNPCKHIAGVYYLVARELDQEPFLLFQLRGISREQLRQELEKTPLGKTLAATIKGESIEIEPVSSYHTKPEKVETEETVNWRNFWQGQKRLPTNVELVTQSPISGVLIKKAGDFPSFWQKDISFIEVMEEFYHRVKNNKKE